MRLALLLSLAVAAACAGPLLRGKPSPHIGDHWHASYAFNVCEVEYPRFGEVEGGIDSHSDGVIHVHPRASEHEGKGSRLVNFFANAGGALSERSLTFPGQAPWRDGNICPGGRPGRVVVIVNNAPITGKVEDYVPRDGDRIVVAFVVVAGVLPLSPPPPSPVAD